ncbi:MAG: response regulator transcription factor [Thiobacillus sp.]|nr:response regulator transcription factor [Gammaproteobacteria bacterium]MDP1925048.1 response regulator transcription factor [Thiobacillus sp.]
MKILLVEDDPTLGEAVMLAIRQAGFTVDWAQDGAQAESALSGYGYDAMLLDLGLPKREGLEVLRHLRKRGDTLPVMILTARDTVEDRVRGLDVGADDYLLKPFSLEELFARLRALLRRAGGKADTQIHIGRLVFDSVKRQACVDDTPLVLSARELEVFEILLSHAGRVTAKEVIADRLTGWDEGVGDNAVEVYIHRLRRKLVGSGVVVRTLRGLGYLLEAEQ